MIKILHMYYDLMNLYGDWANAEVLALELKARGKNVSICKKNIDDEVNFSEYDFLYIGSGTERSLIACLTDITKHKHALLNRIEDGMYVLATGNSHEIFGKAVTDATGTRHNALELLDFEAIQGRSRVTGDCVCKTSFLNEELIGFINRASIGQSASFERPFDVKLGPGASDDMGDAGKKEAIQYKNLLGTYLTGPLLVRNPPLLKYFGDKITGASAQPEENQFFAFQEEAYKKALHELSNRIAVK